MAVSSGCVVMGVLSMRTPRACANSDVHHAEVPDVRLTARFAMNHPLLLTK